MPMKRVLPLVCSLAPLAFEFLFLSRLRQEKNDHHCRALYLWGKHVADRDQNAVSLGEGLKRIK